MNAERLVAYTTGSNFFAVDRSYDSGDEVQETSKRNKKLVQVNSHTSCVFERFSTCLLSFGRVLTLPVLCISESCSKIKIYLNFCFCTSLWCLKRFYESL